ncbi:DUF1648 domain-containing protein [Dietzia cinnamea]|uniref:DUF1648 domain-containing protein n=1 Tax=Dietzia cinnamea TaxID=321318 RepID=UPI000A666211
MTSSSITDEARRLPREPTSRWISGLATVAAAIWLGVFIWQIGVLPPRVPTQFEFSGPPTNWTSKASALITFALTAAVITLTALLSSLVTLRSPRAINAPNRD